MLIRHVIVAFFCLGGLSTTFDSPTIPIFVPIISFIYGMITIPFAFWIGMKKDRMRNWSRPSWKTDPFSGPPHFAHTGGWSFIGFGLVSSSKALIQGHSFILQSFVLMFGLGMLVGIQIFYKFIYQKLNSES